MRVAIIGAGLIGYKRAAAIKKISSLRLKSVCDSDLEKAEALAAKFGAKATKDWRAVIQDPAIDLVIVATPNYLLAPIALAAVKNKKHALIEKPGATSAGDLRKILAAAKRAGVGAWVGYNHRFHPAVTKAHELVRKGAIGDLLYARGVYGHGGRKGYDKEWRANPKFSGGGELMDQGSHLIELFQHFFGEPKMRFASQKTYFWRMSVEDNVFFVLESEKRQVGFFHASWTQWKNKFSFEIFGTKGAIAVSGLGGSYGPETLTFYIRPPQGGVPKEKIWRWRGKDWSFLLELREFLRVIRKKRGLWKNAEEALKTLNIVERAHD